MSKKQKKNKKYGESILYPVAQTPVIDNEGEKIFEEINVEPASTEDKENLEKQGKYAKEKIVIDAINGTKIGTKITDDIKKVSINEIVNKREIAGKKLAISGINLLKELLGVDEVPKEILARLTNKFDELSKTNNGITVDEINSVLGDEVVNKLKKKIFIKSEYDNVVKNLFDQLHASYMNEVQFNDDLSTLSTVLDKLKSLDSELSTDSKMSLDDASKILSGALSQLNKIDGHKQHKKYSIDDVDIRLITTLKDSLDNALSMSKIDVEVNNLIEKFKKDIRKRNKMIAKIETWVNELKSDPETLYPFPIDVLISEKVGSDVAVNHMIEYLTLTIAREKNKQYNIDQCATGILEYYKENGFITDSDISKYKEISLIFLYVLSRTYKIKRIDSEDMRRELSYILDMISKSVHVQYREKITNKMYEVYEKITL